MAADDLNDICIQTTKPTGVVRFDKLCDFFIDKFKQPPAFIVKVPGRYILFIIKFWIKMHIIYNVYDVHKYWFLSTTHYNYKLV